MAVIGRQCRTVSDMAAAKAGHHVTILGKTPRLAGALQLANGFDALARLGMGDAVAPHMTRLSAIELRSGEPMAV